MARGQHDATAPEAAFGTQHPLFGVLGYTSDLDDDSIDPDPDFRACLKLLDGLPGVRTVSSCQGHKPGEQYADVKSFMDPYVTLHGDKGALEEARRHLELVDGVSGFKVDPPKLLIRMRRSSIGAWGAVLASLTRRLESVPGTLAP